jgi:hypothetical protein
MPRTNQQGDEMTAPQGGCTKPHYLELLDRLIAAPDDKARSEILARNKAERAHIPKSRRVMPPYDKKRTSLTQLMPRHLDWVERLATRPARGGSPGRPGYDRSSMLEHFCYRWNSFFAPLRGSKIRDVSSDEFWRRWMINNLLDLVDDRRRSIAEERNARSIQSSPVCLAAGM